MEGTASIEVRDVRKAFGDVVALDDVCLDVAAGQTLALLGPSGCGKTTLLRALAGLEPPDRGRIRIGGDEVDGTRRHLPPERRRVGLVFQDWALFPHLSVARNVAYGLSRAEIAAGRVDETLDLVRLRDLAHRKPHELSGGQSQRVALARALAPRPRVMLFDEPFSSLDADLRVRLRAEVVELMERVGMTAVFVTHDQEEAFALGHEVAVMRRGRIVQTGTAAEVYQRPADAWLAGFVGEANLLPVEVPGSPAQTAIGPVPLRNGAHQGNVLIRPEHIQLDAGGEGLVTSVEFHGHDTSYRVQIGRSSVLVRQMSAPVHAPGDHVTARYVGPKTTVYAAR
jgi:iron(III) transport system ATP-binding protein